MFKWRKPQSNKIQQVQYGAAKKLFPRLQWYTLALVLCLPIVYLVGKIVYNNFYPHANGIITSEEIELSAPMDTYVAKVYAEQGQNVHIGESLIQLSSPQLESEISILNSQLANLLQEKNSYTNHELVTLQDMKQSAFAQYQATRKFYYAMLEYRKDGAVSLLSLNDARLQMINSQRSYEMVLARIQQNQQEFDVNKAQVFDTNIRNLELQIASKTKQQQLLALNSPINGAIKLIDKGMGEYVSKDKTVVILSSVNNFRVIAFVEPKYLNKITVGMKVRIILPNKQFTYGVVENIPQFTDQIYKGLALINDANDLKPIIIIKPSENFPNNFKINGVAVEVLL